MNMLRNLLRPTAMNATIIIMMIVGPALVQADVFTTAENYQFEQIEPRELVPPPKPVSREGPGPEAWVKVRFSINEDGTTSNVEVLDFMPQNHDAGETTEAVEAWTFEPAVVDGSPVAWHNNVVVINIDLPEIPNLTGPRFSVPYAEIQEMITEERYDRAAREAVRNLRDLPITLHDLGVGNVQLAFIEMQREDMHQAYQAISRATLPEITQLTDEELDVALQYRFVVEVSLGRYIGALETYGRRQDLGVLPDGDPMHEQAETLSQALDDGYTLNAKGKILDRDTGWYFVPSRRTFALSDVDGDMDSIEAICNRRTISLEYQEGVEWTLPDSWGDCSLSVHGDRNTTFTFFEFE